MAKKAAAADPKVTKTKETKAKKDPNAPKRATSAYIYFSTEIRPTVLAETPDLAFGEIARKISELWKDLTDSEKKKYEDKAAKDKERYAREKEEYENKKNDA